MYTLEEGLAKLKELLKSAKEVKLEKTPKEIWSMIGRNDSNGLQEALREKTVVEFIENNPYNNI
jgi:hypothetical protein